MLGHDKVLFLGRYPIYRETEEWNPDRKPKLLKEKTT